MNIKLLRESNEHIWGNQEDILQSQWNKWYGKPNLHFKLYVIQTKIY